MLTLGELIARLEELKDQGCGDDPVQTEEGRSPGTADSYRGYYKDLAFADEEETMTVAEFLAEAKRRRNTRLTGYKGGDFLMHDDVDVYFADWGCTGMAIAGLEPKSSGIVLLLLEDDEW